MRLLIQVSLEPKRPQDLQRLTLALQSLTTEDSSVRVATDRDTGQLVLSCRREEHLARALAALAEIEELPVTIGRPWVAYLETITKPVDYIYTHKNITGGSGQYAEVRIAFDPLGRDLGYEFVDGIVDGAIPSEFIAAIEKALFAQKHEGVLAGFPTVDFRATLLDGKFHDVDSNALTFEIAARACFRDAMRLADPVILEPIMKVEIMTPEDSLDRVTAELTRRRGHVTRQLKRGMLIAVEAKAPLSEMLGYAEWLLRTTFGRASVSMDYHSYEPLPVNLVPPDDFPSAIGMRA